MRVQLRYLFGDNGWGLHPQFAFDASLKVHSDGLFLVSAVREFQAITAR